MLGISYGQLFLLIGATAALVGPKDLPRIARTVGRLAGRAIGYVQLARGQFENVMQHSQARQVHKELQDTMAQLDAIRYEIRSLSLMNPGPITRRLEEDSSNPTPDEKGVPEKQKEQKATNAVTEDHSFKTSESVNLHSQATAFARLAETANVETAALKSCAEMEKLNHDIGLLVVLPVSAESAGLLPKYQDIAKGSDVVLEAILEAEVARNAKDFFSQPQNQIHSE